MVGFLKNYLRTNNSYMRRLIICACLAIIAFNASYGADNGFLKGKILKIDMQDVVAERGGNSFQFSLSGISTGSSVSLLSFERALEKAADSLFG